MPTFSYRARDARGRLYRGIMEAENVVAAARELQRRQCIPVEIKPSSAAVGRRREGQFLLRRSRPGSGELALFCRQFATLFGAGVPVVPCLKVLAGQAPSRAFQVALEGVVDRVEGGSTLAEALEAFPAFFPRLMARMVAAEETGGALDQVLERLAAHFEREHELYQKLRSAVTYPAFVMVAASGVAVLLFLHVLPVLAETLVSLNVPLPLVTLAVLAVGETGRRYCYLAPLGALVVLFVVYRQRQSERGRERWDDFLLRLPVVGELWRKMIVARFARTLGTLLGGGVPVVQALEVVSGVLGNAVMEKGLAAARDGVRQGTGMAVPLERTGLFPALVTKMIAVGEESGALDVMLEKVGAFYDREVEAALGRLVALMEPVFITLVGGLVAVVVISVLLPILTLIRTIG